MADHKTIATAGSATIFIEDTEYNVQADSAIHKECLPQILGTCKTDKSVSEHE